MTREIKFRAKFVDTDEWIYGGGVIRLNDGRLGMFHLNSAGLPTLSIVRDESIGEFTGLYDKNGVEIYDGDLLQVNKNSSHKYQIRWQNVQAKFVGFNNHPLAPRYTMTKLAQFGEVIGNIWENPELLT